MICNNLLPDFTSENWQRINMRRVEHVIGAEMIHNLYIRHWPRINSIRFRHTVTYFKDGLVESFAPKYEWVYLQKVLAERFARLDPLLIREINAILHPKYELVNELIERLSTTKLSDLDDKALALLLLDSIDLPLGEIYKLNVVQIEYGLTKALDNILAEYEPNPQDRSSLMSQLIAPGVVTVAQQEELALDAIRRKMRRLRIADPKDNAELYGQLAGTVALYAPKHCAYGELPPTLAEYRDKLIFLETQKTPIKSASQIKRMLAEQLEASKSMLTRLNDPRLNTLCPLMASIGDFRDKNKAKLGETMPYRHAIVDEIARRKQLSAEDARHYLKSEFVNLLFDNQYVDAAELETRKRDGVRFVRDEYLATPADKPSSSEDAGVQKLMGLCASRGRATGKVVVVHGKEDNHKVTEGDIMVAIGTDFDVLDAMYRASGIITEEGGLLSHASVVSRELEKPCVIGVARATQILRDGMEVILDATNSTVEIIG